ncbi:hypothetical protein M2651_13180 [Clostridium sp. SYSU_GA19001]|uniref:hypothetical protein n=1 Tax=Clostridium caldaquaticum TaxID=2940653 RepID=UPI00207747C0|nr:hypothetical protein [Clostridium caldaquaticum]MCM8711952.1 hypothetical protein [Clostridium caldaquaticum]
MKNIASSEQLMMVAVNCPGYVATSNNFTNTVGANNCKSCTNCSNWQNNKCTVNLFDSVLTDLDQG